MKGYKTSKDYKRLKELLDKGYIIIVMNPTIVIAKMARAKMVNGYILCDCLGWKNTVLNDAPFEEYCERNFIEFIEPEEEEVWHTPTDRSAGLEYWLRHFGMPEENIERCVTQIAKAMVRAATLKVSKSGRRRSMNLPNRDFEKEVDKWRDKNFDKHQDFILSGVNATRKSQIELARHFYNLGLNSKK